MIQAHHKMAKPSLSYRFVTACALLAFMGSKISGTLTGQQSRETRADLLAYFSRISGQYTITGQHNREPNSNPLKWSRVVRDITGVLPGLWGGDFLFLPDDVNNRQTMIDEAIRQWNSGSVVALTWHVCPPTVGETCNWDDSGILTHLNDDQWEELVTAGTPLNIAWQARLDTIVPYLQELKSSGVIPIFRPIHEMNEGWSWWGGRSGPNGSAKLYRITYNRLVNHHNLDNMIWTWCVKDVDMNNIGQYWPGDEFVDVASLDIWMNIFPSDQHYDQMLQVANGKPIALGEVGAVPSPSILQRQNRWIWFMVWAEYLKDPAFNTDDSVKATYYLNNALHQGDLDFGDGGPTNIAIGRPVAASSSQNSSFLSQNVNDGLLDTRWSSNTNTEQWIYIDLGGVTEISRAVLHWEAAFAVGYQLQTSSDGADWRTVHEDYAGNGGVDSVPVSVATRYLKIYMFNTGTEYGYSLYEVEIFR